MEVLYGSKECKTGGKDRKNWEKVGKFVELEICTLKRCSKQHSKKEKGEKEEKN
jgi:hypothetical protein